MKQAGKSNRAIEKETGHYCPHIQDMELLIRDVSKAETARRGHQVYTRRDDGVVMEFCMINAKFTFQVSCGGAPPATKMNQAKFHDRRGIRR
ncbi:MAG: hypothetical protein LBK41_06460 [Clostridiales bacterium]|jgi:hypothetical protein|nr:hypothetical protein [Clostridiales bacterium]